MVKGSAGVQDQLLCFESQKDDSLLDAIRPLPENLGLISTVFSRLKGNGPDCLWSQSRMIESLRLASMANVEDHKLSPKSWRHHGLRPKS